MRTRGGRLLFLALLAGCAPKEGAADAARAGEPWFTEEAARRGLAFAHRSGHEGKHLMPEIMCGGAALFDPDGDGDLDAYLVQGGSLGAAPEGPDECADRLFENTGAGRFRVAEATRGAGGRGYGMGAATGDADEDGDPDLYVTRLGPNRLLENQGGLRFADATERAGVGDAGWGTSAAFFDADRDGDLDLFVANYLEWSPGGELPCLNTLSSPDYCSPRNYKAPALDVFYVNQGAGRFADASGPSGIGTRRGTGLGVVAGDVDGDGWQDVFVANDGMANHLWLNRGDLSFRENAMLAGCGVDASGQEKAGMGVVLADLDHDLDLDLLVCNLAGESDSLYANEQGFFVDRTALAGFGPVSRPFTRFGVGCFDFDQDGQLDLFEATGRVAAKNALEPGPGDIYGEEDLLFRGLGPALFEEVEPRGGTAELLRGTGRAAAFGDVDGDGDVDVLVVNRDGPAHLLMNAAARGAWVLLRVRERSGRDALGATLEFELGGLRQRREVVSASSYQSANDPRVHVGLGAQRELATVHVRWVDGTRETFGPLASGQVHTLERGKGRPLD